MDNSQSDDKQIIDVCLLAGKIMLQNGAETYRVEDTMIRMAQTYTPKAESFVTPTGIVFGLGGKDGTQLIRVSERGINLNKVAQVNDISRNLCRGVITVLQAFQQLEDVERENHTYHFFVQVASAAIASGCFLIMFRGQWSDFLAAMMSGGLGYSCLLLLHRFTRVKFFAEFAASFTVVTMTYLMIILHLGHLEDKIVIASVMPLVPGILITNAVRDLMAGHLVSGTTKGIEALLTALAVGGGVATTLSLF